MVPLPKTAVLKTVKDGGAWNVEQEHLTPTVAPYGKRKGKRKKVLPKVQKALQHKDNVSQDHHGRRLCFNF